MHIEYFDFKRAGWDAETLARILTRLQENGYQGLVTEIHQILGRYVHSRGDRTLAATLARGETFADAFIPPAQPNTRIILHRAQSDVLRAVIAGRSQREVRLAATAVKVHLEAALGNRSGEMIADESGRASLAKFRRDVLPALRLTGESGPPVELRHTSATQVLNALRRSSAIRGKPTVLASKVAALAPDQPAEQTRQVLDQLVPTGAVERWYVVVCHEGGQWLAVSPSADEIKTYLSLNVTCPHCGTRVGEERQDVAYRLGDKFEEYLVDNRMICDQIETALRRAGVEAVAVRPGAGPVDGAACYHGAVILFRAKNGSPGMEDAAALQEQAKQLKHEGWRVFSLLVSDQPVPASVKETGVAVIEGLGRLDGALEEVLLSARQQHLAALLPSLFHPIAIAVDDLLPGDQPAARESQPPPALESVER